MRVALISCYEMGRQPFGLASPAAWLRSAGFEVDCVDLSQEHLESSAAVHARLAAFYLPMHTATRIAANAVPRLRALNPEVQLCAYGLYAPLNAEFLRTLGVAHILGGEFESALVNVARAIASGSAEPTFDASLQRLDFQVPDRGGLAPLKRYAKLRMPGGARKTVGYTEATRGCKHLCRHCPIVPVYQGTFRVVPREVVLADVRQQVEAGAQHITFGDPDFFNGPAHAMAIVREVHQEFPALTFDATIKIEHLLKHAGQLHELRECGCAFITSAVESVDDAVLKRLDKGHTRADFYRVARLFREANLVLAPTFVAFHPWTTLDSYHDFLDAIAELDLIEHVPPVQLSIRLLIPTGSRLLELSEVLNLVGPFDPRALAYPWVHSDPRVDTLQNKIEAAAREAGATGDRTMVFDHVRELLRRARAGDDEVPEFPDIPLPARATIPYLTEPWYC